MADVESRLFQLESAQLVRRLTEEEGTFIFKHTLTQEVAYGSLLLKKRSEIHRHVAQSLEGVFSGRLDEFAALLAQHYEQAGDNEKAFEYSVRAGDAAMRLFAHAEAVAHYSRALKLARSVRVSASPTALEEALVHIYLTKGRALELSGQYAEALANYEEMEKNGTDRGDELLELAGLMERAKLYILPNPNRDTAKGRALNIQALAAAQRLNDRAAEAKILWTLLLADLFGGGNVEDAIANGKRSLALSQELGLSELAAYTTNDLGIAHFNLGDYEGAQVYVNRALALWRDLGNLPMLTDSLGNASALALYKGDYAEAVRIADEGFDLSRSIGNTWGEAHTRFLLGNVFLDRGEWGQAIEIMDGAIRSAEQAGNPGVQVGTRADLAWTMGCAGAFHRGVELARLAEEFAAARFEIMRAWPFAVLSRLYLLQGNIPDAETAISEGRRSLVEGVLLSPMLVRIAEVELALAKREYSDALNRVGDLMDYLMRRKLRIFVPDALYLRARGHAERRDDGQALEALAEAKQEAESLGSRRMLWQILALTAEVEARRGNEAGSRKPRGEAL